MTPLGDAVTTVIGKAVVVRGDDLDTDRIIPARFLRCVTFDGLGAHLFADERVDPATGLPTGHPLDDPRFRGASVMISGSNFGCGSSREHAPQSIARAGFDAIVAGSFAEIFFANSTTLGLVCVALAPADLAALSASVEADPGIPVTIDVSTATVIHGEDAWTGTLPDGARDALVTGQWDPLQALVDRGEAVLRLTADLPYVAGFDA